DAAADAAIGAGGFEDVRGHAHGFLMEAGADALVGIGKTQRARKPTRASAPLFKQSLKLELHGGIDHLRDFRFAGVANKSTREKDAIPHEKRGVTAELIGAGDVELVADAGAGRARGGISESGAGSVVEGVIGAGEAEIVPTGPELEFGRGVGGEG